MQVFALRRHRGDDVPDAKVGGQLIDGLVLAPAQASVRERQANRPYVQSRLSGSRVDRSKPCSQCAVDVKGESLRTHSIMSQLRSEGWVETCMMCACRWPVLEHLRAPQR